MNGLRLSEFAEGNWQADATDGRCLAILRGQNMRETPALDDEENPPAFQGILPTGQLLTAMRSVPKGGHLGVRLTAKAARLQAGELTLETPLIEGRYPDVMGVFPRAGAPFSMHVDADLLMRLLKAAKEVRAAKGEKGEPNRVTLYFWRPDTPMAITTEGPEGTLLDAILMPMT